MQIRAAVRFDKLEMGGEGETDDPQGLCLLGIPSFIMMENLEGLGIWR